jgi:methylmalonyl-CoA/ethylmalonyl-CoA epimerase
MDPRFRTHHIGVLVKDVAQALERYTVSLGYEIKSELIHDPAQTAYVQFLSLPGESEYLELISPDGPNSKLANALKKEGGINHICYSVPSVEDAMAALRERGFTAIQPPQPAVAFKGRRIAWLMNRDHLLIELVERGETDQF